MKKESVHPMIMMIYDLSFILLLFLIFSVFGTLVLPPSVITFSLTERLMCTSDEVSVKWPLCCFVFAELS